jgi:hypothetical protein
VISSSQNFLLHVLPVCVCEGTREFCMGRHRPLQTPRTVHIGAVSYFDDVQQKGSISEVIIKATLKLTVVFRRDVLPCILIDDFHVP